MDIDDLTEGATASGARNQCGFDYVNCNTPRKAATDLGNFDAPSYGRNARVAYDELCGWV